MQSSKLILETNKDKRLEILIRVGEKGLIIIEFNPDLYIEKWYKDIVICENGGKPIKYQNVTVLLFNWSHSLGIGTVTLSNLESSDD